MSNNNPYQAPESLLPSSPKQRTSMTTQRWMRALIIFQFAGVISGAIFARYEWTGLFFFQAMLLPATLTGLSIPVALLFILAKRPQLTAATGFLVAEFLIGAALVIALLPAIQ